MKSRRLFLLSWRKLVLIIVAWVLAVILHNLVYGLFKDFFDSHGADEPFFFFIALIIIPLYVLVSLVYSLVYLIRRRIRRG